MFYKYINLVCYVNMTCVFFKLKYIYKSINIYMLKYSIFHVFSKNLSPRQSSLPFCSESLHNV